MSRQALKDSVYLIMAQTVARLATCPTRAVGAVVVDNRGIVRGVGYNGVPRGMAHCTASCDPCRAVHAEANAMLVAGHSCLEGTLYCTTMPCHKCFGLIANAGIREIVFSELNDEPKRIIELCTAAGIYLYQFSYYSDNRPSREGLTGVESA